MSLLLFFEKATSIQSSSSSKSYVVKPAKYAHRNRAVIDGLVERLQRGKYYHVLHHLGFMCQHHLYDFAFSINMNTLLEEERGIAKSNQHCGKDFLKYLLL